jgi:hypothetical protein
MNAIVSTEELPTLGEDSVAPTAAQRVNALLWETRMLLDFLEGDLTPERSWLRGSRLQ